MKKVVFLLIFSIVSVLAIGQTVHYTRTGKKYHSSSCQSLRRSDLTCSLNEALNMGLSACSRCSPPTKVIQPKPKAKVKAVKRKKKQTSYLRKQDYKWAA